MAFSKTITKKTAFGDMFVHMGTYTQASGDTGGAIATGLSKIFNFQATGALTAVNSSGTVTITTADPGAAQTGYWVAYGY